MPISVIMPAYKARKYLPECLESIGKQTLQPAEVLVIDDASPEPIDDIVEDFGNREGYPPIRLIKHEVNRGQAAGRNTGIREASGDWLAFIDCDDMWAPNHLESVMATATESGADLVFCPATLFNSDPHDPSNYRLRPLTDDESALRPISILNRCFIITSSTIIRKNRLSQISGFDESPGLRGVEDLDCFLRLLRERANFTMATEATLYYRKHPDSATGTIGYLARQDITVKQRHIEWVEGLPSEKKRIMMDSFWRAAIQLSLVHAPDRASWILAAFRHSLTNPLRLPRWIYRFFRAHRRKSDAGL